MSWNLLNTEDVSVLLLRCFFLDIVITGSTQAFYERGVYSVECSFIDLTIVENRLCPRPCADWVQTHEIPAFLELRLIDVSVLGTSGMDWNVGLG